MLQGETRAGGESEWAAMNEAPDWREVDRRLRRLARQRARLDHDEMAALRDAMRVQVWREIGCASMREYLERVFGYGPRVASDRLRVAAALDAMPELDDALATNELPYSAVREISRVATSRTADAWVDACRGKCLRDIEELVAQHAEGDLPDAPPREHERPQSLRIELQGSDYALWRQARQVLEGERDEAVSDRELFAAACTALIERARTAADQAPNWTDLAHVGTESTSDRAHVGTESTSDCAQVGTDSTADGAHVGAEARADTQRLGTEARSGTQRLGSEAQRGRAKYQIAVVVCEVCKRGWQEGGGKRIPISAVDVARAQCDAQRVGSLDGDPEAAVQDIPPKTRRFVFRRDGDRCTVPGCRASAFIEVHHIVHREDGGGNEPENLALLCGGHHDAHHAGQLVIRGRAPNLTFELAGQLLEGAGRHAHVGTPPHGGDAPLTPERDARSSPPVAELGCSAALSRDADVQRMRADAVLALHTLGFKKPEAVAAVDVALAAVDGAFDLETLLRLALQRCPRPTVRG